MVPFNNFTDFPTLILAKKIVEETGQVFMLILQMKKTEVMMAKILYTFYMIELSKNSGYFLFTLYNLTGFPCSIIRKREKLQSLLGMSLCILFSFL